MDDTIIHATDKIVNYDDRCFNKRIPESVVLHKSMKRMK